MKQYKVWIHVEEIDEDHDIYEDVGECYSAGSFETEQAARDYIEQELMTTHVCGSAVMLLEACKDVTSLLCNILRQMNDQVDLNDYPAIRSAQMAIQQHWPAESPETVQQSNLVLEEQDVNSPSKFIPIRFSIQDGQLWMQFKDYGEKCTTDGEGSPVGIEIWQGRLRLVIFDDINREEPRVIDLENARESNRLRCN